MKKLFGLLAIGAIVLGMASCSDENVKLKKFKVSIGDITTETAVFSITAPTENTMFVYMIESKHAFIYERNYCMALLQGDLPTLAKGKAEWVSSQFLPGNEFILLVSEIDSNGNLVGDVEYVIFKMQDLEAKELENINDNHPLRHLTGTVNKSDEGVLQFNGEGGGNSVKITLSHMVYANGWTGKFNRDNLAITFFDRPHIYWNDNKCEIFNTEFTGVATGSGYVYEGWMDVIGEMDGEKGAWRLPFRAECTDEVEEK